MKRKILVICTAICLVFTMIAAPFAKVSAETKAIDETTKKEQTTEAKESKAMPEIGDKVHGFELKKMGYDSSTKTFKFLFIHEKTGAKLLVLKNSDKNRGFSIKFNTPADNDKGINHIIEHAVLAGSKKYPSNNIIFDVSNATYVSFANAMTFQNMTAFPICSASEEQLLKSADTYLDAVFNPLFLTDKRIFEREGIRYELAKESADLSCNGIVYNEMQGNMGNLERAAAYNAKKAIFPDSNQGNNSGGNPDQIMQLTYEELIETYKKNYHPSNSLSILYGDLDYEVFMKMIDENYLVNYTKKTYKIDRSTQKEFGKLQEKNYSYPAAKGEVKEKSSVIDLAFALSDAKKLGYETFTGLDMAITLLNLDNSEIKKAMQSSGIGESYSISFGADTYQPTIHFIAFNADPTMKQKFYDLVMKEVKKVVSDGFDTELVKSSLRSIEFSKALGNNSSSAVNSIINASLFDNLFNNPLLNLEDYYKKVVQKVDDKILESIIQEQILGCKTAALVVTTPKAGLLEQNEEAKIKELKQKKASLTKLQQKDLVQKTKDFTQWNNQKTPDEVIKSLRAVSLKDLTAEIRDRNVKETTIDGAKLWTADADVASISSINMTFDLSHLTAEELLYLKFYSDMLGGGMATTKRTESQVINELTLRTNRFLPAVNVMMEDINDTSAYPVFNVSYYGFNDEYALSFDIVSDLLLEAKVSEVSTYGTRTIANLKAQYQSMFGEPLTIAILRASAYTSPSYQYYNYLMGLDYYKFVLSLEKDIETDPGKVADRLKTIRTKAFNKNNLKILLAGDNTSQNKFAASVPEFTKKLPDVTYEKAVYTLPKPSKREALTINSSVQYVVVNASLRANDISISGKAEVVSAILNNLMLTPEIRLKGGAYGVSATFGNSTYNTFTYRDSNFVNSLATIGATDEFLKAIAPYLTEDSLESYKLPAYAAVSQSYGEINDAMNVLENKCRGISNQDRLNILNEIKEASVADILQYAEYMEKLNSDLNYVVVASPSEIEANKELFDTVISLQ